PARRDEADHPGDQAVGLARARPRLDQKTGLQVLHDPGPGRLVGERGWESPRVRPLGRGLVLGTAGPEPAGRLISHGPAPPARTGAASRRLRSSPSPAG